MPWPAELVTFVQIGRLADNDIVLNDQESPATMRTSSSSRVPRP